jgi:hypothetical protein
MSRYTISVALLLTAAVLARFLRRPYELAAVEVTSEK